MQKQLKHIIICLSLISTVSNATECDTVLKACDEALKQSLEQREKQRIYISNQEELVLLLSKQRNEAYEELSKKGENYPWYVWAIVGAATGVILTRGLR